MALVYRGILSEDSSRPLQKLDSLRDKATNGGHEQLDTGKTEQPKLCSRCSEPLVGPFWGLVRKERLGFSDAEGALLQRTCGKGRAIVP